MEKENRKKPKANVSEEKKKLLKELMNLIDKNNTVMIASTINIPSLQFQKIKRDLREKATLKVIKKSIALRALEESKETKKNIEKLEQFIGSGFAMIFTNLDAFDLASILAESKIKAKIKAGQTAPKDIVIEAGPTDLPAGPAISELSKAKIKAGIEGGKIVVKERCVVTKAGEKVSEEIANVLAKLEIEPLSISLEPIAAYDSTKQKIYTEIKIDKEEMLKQLKENALLSIMFSINLVYPTSENIKALIQKANIQEKFISNLIKQHSNNK